MSDDDRAGLAMEAKTIGDVEIDTDAHPGGGDGESVIIKFRGCENKTQGRLFLSPEQAASLARDLDREVEWLGHDPHELMIQAAVEQQSEKEAAE